VADVLFDGFGGVEVNVGVGGAAAANTVYAPNAPTRRTPSSATSADRLALLAVLFQTPRPIRTRVLLCLE
jgi:hypothetical protein